MLKDELAAQKDTLDCMSDDIALLSEEVEQWKDVAGEMRVHYEEAIHSLTPETFGKHWVKNIEKKVRFWVRLFRSVSLSRMYSHSLTVTNLGGTMQWTMNVDKLILDWLANRTPPVVHHGEYSLDGT